MCGKDGTLDGKTVRWNIGEFTCCGQVEDSGRTMSDIKVTITRSGMLFGVFDGLRLFEASCWTSHPGYDLRGRADAEQMDARDLDAVKRRVEKMGYAGFCVWQGFAYIKGCGSKPLTQEDLEYGGDENPVVFHLFTPPDPHEEARRWARRQGAQPEAQRAAEPQVEAPREPSRDAAAPAHRPPCDRGRPQMSALVAASRFSHTHSCTVVRGFSRHVRCRSSCARQPVAGARARRGGQKRGPIL